MEFQTHLNTIKDLLFDYSPRIATALILLFTGLWLTSFLTKIFKKILLQRDVEITLTNFLGNVIFWTLRIILFITVISKLGVETSSFVAIFNESLLLV